MKTNLPVGLSILLSCILFVSSCKKSADPLSESVNPNSSTPHHDTTITAVNTTVHPYPVTQVLNCIYTPNYGDSVVYPQPGSGNSYLYPKNTQGLQGTYLSWPAGLVIDANTGTINLTQSQTGQRYDIAFVQYGTTDTCISQLVVAGTAYMDSIYVLGKGNSTATPYFNANPSTPSPCSNSQSGHGCQFDYNDYAKRQGIEVDKNSGYIDLGKTAIKVFGLFPLNGTTINTTIFYKLRDNSNNAPQQISLQMIYYNRVSDIPAALRATIATRRNNTLNNQTLKKGTTRPPLIIIVRFN